MPPRYPSSRRTLEDLLSAIRVAVQQPRDARLKGIKDTAARPAAPRLEARTRRPRGDCPRVKAQCPGGLRDSQALAIMAVVDLAERLVIDHDRLRRQARAAPPAPRMWRECPGPVVANGRWCGRCHLVTASRPNGRLSQSEQQAAPLRHLVTATMPDWLFRWEDQWGAPLRYLVTQGRHVDPCANTRDGATAKLGPGQRSRRRGSSFGSQAWRASGLGWRSCWPLCRHGPSSNTGVGGYAGRDELTSDSTCVYGGPHGPFPPDSPKVGDGANREGGISWECLTPPLLHRRCQVQG